MKTLTQWLIDRLRGRERTHIDLHAQSGEVIIRQGLRRVRLSQAEYLQLVQLKGGSNENPLPLVWCNDQPGCTGCQ